MYKYHSDYYLGIVYAFIRCTWNERETSAKIRNPGPLFGPLKQSTRVQHLPR